MIPSWRWFGPKDPISLREIRQAGVTGIVTALHHIPCGELWTVEEISARKRLVEWDEQRNRPTGLCWSVTESLPVHESIKTRTGDWRRRMDIYLQSVRNLAAVGVTTICYNFMPVLDWTRTDLEMEFADGSSVLHCDWPSIVAFDVFILRRPGAEGCYSADELSAGRRRFEQLDEAGRKHLSDTILLGLPGTVDDLTPEQFLEMLARYQGIDAERLRGNLIAFLTEVVPLCDQLGMRMAIHPDDPPRDIFGLPRILSTPDDVQRLIDAVPSRANGLTLCTGSFGGRADNNVAGIAERFADRVHFAHLRNVSATPDDTGRSFCESGHLEGRVDMARVMSAVMAEEDRRRAAWMAEPGIPVRPDHGRLLDCDRQRGCYPGYSYAGRLLGLAELRGLEAGLRASRGGAAHAR
jgi:mannonate dehydratase